MDNTAPPCIIALEEIEPCMASHERGEVTPAPHEIAGRKESLGKTTIGLQAALLLDGAMPHGATLNQKSLIDIKDIIDTGGHPPLTRITQSSYQERQTYWQQDQFNHLTTHTDRRTEWERHTDQYLATFSTDDKKKDEAAILTRIGILNNNGAKGIYDEFFTARKGELGYFAKKVARELTQEEITKHTTLIQQIGKLYGKDSAAITRHLTEAIKNLTDHTPEFLDEAQKQFSPGMEGTDLLKGIQERAKLWEERGQTAQTTTTPQEPHTLRAAQEPIHPEKEAQKEAQLVLQAGRETETKSKNARVGRPNQDACFADEENGAFGVCDGLGSYEGSGEVSKSAATHLQTGLSQIERNLRLNEAVEQVEETLKSVNATLLQEEDIRYQAVLLDVQRLLTNELPAAEFERKYPAGGGQSFARWIQKYNLDPAKPDEFPQLIKDWASEHVRAATTASVVKVWRGEGDERKAIVVNVGDSRVYHYSAADNKLNIVTLDDTPLLELVDEAKAREIQEAIASGESADDVLKGQTITLHKSNPMHEKAWNEAFAGISLAQRFAWQSDNTVRVPLRHFYDTKAMSKALPRAGIAPIPRPIDIKPGDRLVVVSDGIADFVKSPTMKQVLTDPANQDADRAAKALVEAAKGPRGELEDDATAVVINL